MSPRTLTATELRFVNLVASRRFAGADPAPSTAADAPPPDAASPFARAAALAASVLQDGGTLSAPRATALLALLTQLALEGFTLFAPQGAAQGMIEELSARRIDADAVAAWLEDRAIAAG